jgi:hypothetical protein|tara:strand:- start:352 stop:879 length:528 start_codon:yes stop_codon:yes gene_type:complete
MLIMRVITLGLVLLLSGCQYFEVQSGQLSSLITAFTSEPDALPDTRWSVEFGGYSAAVQPVITDDATVFVNNLDAISFDGWSIIKVSGLNSFIPAWEIQDSGNERAFVVDGRVVAKHRCDSWLKYDTETGVRFEQQCTGKQAYTNTILVGSLGQITDIEQVVDSTLMVLRLRLNN